MTVATDPLARLVADEAEIDRELLATVLEGRVRLDLGRGSFAFLGGVRDRVTQRQLVTVALLAQKALHLLNPQYPQGLRATEIEPLTGTKGATLRPILRLLHDRSILRQDEGKAYFIADYALEDAARMLNERGE